MTGRDLERAIQWFSSTAGMICRALKLESAGSRALLAIEIFLIFFLIVIFGGSLTHEILAAIIEGLGGPKLAHYTGDVLLVSVLLITLSLGSVFLREIIELRNRIK